MVRLAPWTWSHALRLLLLASVCLAAAQPGISKLKEDNIAKAYAYFDDSSSIVGVRNSRLIISFDDGKSWRPVAKTKDAEIIHFQLDPFLRDRAFAFTSGTEHFVTYDKGKNWKSFRTQVSGKEHLTFATLPRILFNSKNPNYALYNVYACPDNSRCQELYFYTTDGFKSDPKVLELGADAAACHFAKSTVASAAKDDIKDELIFCAKNKVNSFGHVVESALVKSTDFFNKHSEVVDYALANTGSIIDIKVVQNFLLVVLRTDKFNPNSKVSILVSRDYNTFDLSDIVIDVSYGTMRFLDSSPSSLTLSVVDYNNAYEQVSFSTIYTSDSSGLVFTKRLEFAKSDSISKVQNIDGSWLALVGDDRNDDDGDSGSSHAPSLVDLLLGGDAQYFNNLKSQITIDDGKTWNPLKVIDYENCKLEDGCSLHLLSPTERDGEGRFVTGPTPGILLGVGNVGTRIEQDVGKMHTFFSRDGGVTWRFALKEPCLFSFGDLGNVIVAIPYYERDYSSTDYYYYSVDQGSTWEKVKLDTSIYPLTLTTTIDGTSTKFLLTGLFDEQGKGKGEDPQYSEVIFSINFDDSLPKVCGKSDFEEVYARVDAEGNPTCVYGHKEKFSRRKPDANCFVRKLYEDLKATEEPCKCTPEDFECSKYFTLDTSSGECKLDSKKVAYQCSKEKKGAKLDVTNKVRISNNLCELSGQKESDFVEKQSINCADYTDDGNGSGDDNKNGGSKTNADIITKLNVFGDELSQYAYFEKGEDFHGENVVVQLDNNELYGSNNGGIDFVKVRIPEKVVGYYNGYVPGQIIVLTSSDIFYVSLDGINYLTRHTAPSSPNGAGSTAVSFHKTDVNKFIWYNGDDCVSKYSTDCNVVAYHTEDGGKSFDKLREGVKVCDYVSPFFKDVPESLNNTIFCTTDGRRTGGKQSLVSTTNNFRDEKVIFENIVGYAITGDYVVAATVDEASQALKAKVTIDGDTFADADFPNNLNVHANQAYTVLDSITESIFLHVTTNNIEGHEFGAILKSNSNGTSYVLSLDNVNRNKIGYVDYDRIDGLEGTIIANSVHNPEKVLKDNVAKVLKTQISHNDGAEWAYLTPPSVNSKGEKYSCIGSSINKCSLNLHGFTERPDYRDTYSSASATGLIIGVGNVGEYLAPYSESSTFLSRDGGITWKEIIGGVHMWEYGDRGTILVIAPSSEATETLRYSLDEGETWIEYKFTGDEGPIKVLDLATVPSDTSRKFIIFGHKKSSERETLSFSIDFSNVHKRQCQLDLDNPYNDDYEYWTPKHPMLTDNCLFGHEAKYLRRAVGHNDCFIGSAPLKEGFKTIRNCSCTRRDFECDYNYFRDTDGTCKLVPGLSPTDRQNEQCKKEGAFEYFQPTGYRKIPLSTCVGGKTYDSWDAHACPGKEQEFNKHYGKEISGSKVFILIIVPILVFFFSVWFVYDRGIRRNGGFKRLGQIRLDLEDDDGGFHPIEENEVDRVVNKIVSGGIYTAAVVIATFKTIRKIDRMMLDKIVSSIFRRSGRSGRGRNYVSVPTDYGFDEEEEELFRDNVEDELNDDDIMTTNPFHDDDNGELTEDDITNFHDEDRDARDVDSRLFNIDDQSEEDLSASR